MYCERGVEDRNEEQAQRVSQTSDGAQKYERRDGHVRKVASASWRANVSVAALETSACDSVGHTFSAHKDRGCDQPDEVLAGVHKALGLHDADRVELVHEINVLDPVAQVPVSVLARAVPAAPYAAWNFVFVVFRPAHVGDGAPQECEAAY
jgi:hypothetical protein